MIYHFKIADKLQFFASHHFNFGKYFKTHFPKGFFNEICLVIGDYKYIYITEIEIANFYSCGISGAKQFIPHPKNF